MSHPQRKPSSCEEDIGAIPITSTFLAVTSQRTRQQHKPPLNLKSLPPSCSQLQGIAVRSETVLWVRTSSVLPRASPRILDDGQVTAASEMLVSTSTGTGMEILHVETGKQMLPKQRLKRHFVDSSHHSSPRSHKHHLDPKRNRAERDDDRQNTRDHRERNFLYDSPTYQDKKQRLKDRLVYRDQTQPLRDRQVGRDQKQCPSDRSDGQDRKQMSDQDPGQSEIDGQLQLSISLTSIPRYKRRAHIQAEFRRREKIQKGFDRIKILVPALQSAENPRPSNVAVLSKCAQYIRDLESDIASRKDEMEKLRMESNRLSKEITNTQQKLPPCIDVSAQSPVRRSESILEDYFRSSIHQNWKFWIFGFFVRPLVSSFTREVSLATREEFERTLQEWSENRLNIVFLRALVVSLLRQVSTATSILSDPEKLEKEVKDIVNRDTVVSFV